MTTVGETIVAVIFGMTAILGIILAIYGSVLRNHVVLTLGILIFLSSVVWFL